jgi:hypothetical protein
VTQRKRRSAYGADMFSLSLDAWSLYLDASTVIGMRLMKMAAGGAGADREAALMVREKLQSAADLQMAGATGKLGTTPRTATKKIMHHYKTKVRANKQRLSR